MGMSTCQVCLKLRDPAQKLTQLSLGSTRRQAAVSRATRGLQEVHSGKASISIRHSDALVPRERWMDAREGWMRGMDARDGWMDADHRGSMRLARTLGSARGEVARWTWARLAARVNVTPHWLPMAFMSVERQQGVAVAS